MKPNILYIFSDQHRADAAGYAGDMNVKTPNMDAMAAESIDFRHCVSNNPLCIPYRATLMTGMYWDRIAREYGGVPLSNRLPVLGQILKDHGYQTGYIGKWHLDRLYGERAALDGYVPPENRLGFDYWRVHDLTHKYNESYYYDENGNKLLWDGYDAQAQTQEAIKHIRSLKKDKPFALFLSWGPPHNPYDQAPGEFKDLYKPEDMVLRPNVPEEVKAWAKKTLSQYYSQVTVIDSCLGEIIGSLKEMDLEDNTILIYTSDHGDMLGSQGSALKMQPWDESTLVPFLLRYPGAFGRKGRRENKIFSSVDIMPTILGLSGIDVPQGTDGKDWTPVLKGQEMPQTPGALLERENPAKVNVSMIHKEIP
ncbi:MAG TPA: sulfatase, partial [Clostridiales bacterium]|nr:sulfatase [Clostridiales bacterium]